MNVQLSSRSDSWESPPEIVELARQVLGEIDFDPASDDGANEVVKATQFYTVDDDALVKEWPSGCSVFCNPPGGKLGNRSKVELFWGRLMEYRSRGLLKHAVFLAFSAEALQTTQRHGRGIAEFPFCIPRRRIRFVDPWGMGRAAPSHSNVIVYVPGTVDVRGRFAEVFGELGAVTNVGY